MDIPSYKSVYGRQSSATTRSALRCHNKLFGAVTAVLATVGLLVVGAGNASAKPALHATSHITLTEEDYWGSQPQEGAFNWLFSTYEKTHPNVTITRDIVPGAELTSKVLSQAQTHTLPDIVVNDNPYVPQDWATGGFVALNSYLSKWGQWSSYLPGSQAITTVHGIVDAIQIGAVDLLMFYNKAIFAKAGITTVPTTWSQLYTDSQKIMSKVKGLTYGAISFGASSESNCSGGWQFEPWLLSAGAKLSVPDMTAPGTVAALSLWVKLVKNGLATKSVLSMCQSTNLPWLEEGSVAMIEDGTWDLATVESNHAYPSKMIGFFKMPVESPADKAGTPLGGENWEIAKNNPATEQAAWNFLEWSQQPKILLEFDNMMDYIGVRSPVYEEQASQNKALMPFVQELSGGASRTQYLGANYGTYSTDMADAIGYAILGEETPLAALQAAQKQVKETIG